MRRFSVTSLFSRTRGPRSRSEDPSLATTVIAARRRLSAPSAEHSALSTGADPENSAPSTQHSAPRFRIRYLATFILAVAAFLFALTSFLTVPANSETSHATFAVAAHVPAKVELKRIAGPQTLLITAQDARAGYKDAVLRYRVTTNDPQGPILRLSPMIGLTTSMTVTGLLQPLEIHEDEVEIAQRSSGAFSIHVRFSLKDNVPPGTYPVPLVLSASTFPSAASGPPALVAAQ